MANLITISRFPLMLLIILLLYTASPVARLVSTVLLPILIGMDMLDGLVARARREVSLLGSVLDIMTDRSVEQVMWVVFAHMSLVSVAVPIVFILRGAIVDSLRAVHVGEGQAPFSATRTRLGRFIVGSPWMRSSYGIIKLLAFTGLALAHTLFAYAAQGVVSQGIADTVWLIFRILSWIAVAFCILRGLPVVIESSAWLRSKHQRSDA